MAKDDKFILRFVHFELKNETSSFAIIENLGKK
jgi:hypothetical protein